MTTDTRYSVGHLDIHLEVEENVSCTSHRLLVVEDEVLGVVLQVFNQVFPCQVEHFKCLAETQEGEKPEKINKKGPRIDEFVSPGEDELEETPHVLGLCVLNWDKLR